MTARDPALRYDLSPFPESPRVLYGKNPLVQVLCQIRFPPILRIETELPAGFQESIREQFPEMRDRTNDVLGLSPDTPPAIAALFRSVPGKRAQTAYDFVSSDGIWTVSLTRDFLTLSTTKYRRWEHFKEHFEGPFQALLREYKPIRFSRIGLRYVDVITRSELGLSERNWPELIRPPLVGILANQLNVDIVGTFANTVIKFHGNTGNLLLNHGLANTQPDQPEVVYVVDGDYYTDENTEPQDVHHRLDFFNQQSGRFFRWCITDTLHDAMEPEYIGAANR